MRSTDHSNYSAGTTPAERFGAVVDDLARKAGYDTSAGGGGRTALARDTGMSPSAVGRMLAGKTLPQPSQFEAIARAVHADVRELLVTGGVISAESWSSDVKPDVVSGTSPVPPLSPEAAADMWGVKEPGIRSMLISSVRQAIRLQNEVNSRRDHDSRGEAAGRRG